MKIGIISDTHDNWQNLKEFLNFAKKEKIKILIHCGDVCQGETLEKIEKNFEGKIFLAIGNCDLKESFLPSPQKTKIFDKIGELEIENLKIGFCHQFDLNKREKDLKQFNFFFFGHTHWPFFKEEKNCILANPGNLAGLFYKASFALLNSETRNLQLFLVEEIKEGS